MDRRSLVFRAMMARDEETEYRGGDFRHPLLAASVVLKQSVGAPVVEPGRAKAEKAIHLENTSEQNRFSYERPNRVSAPASELVCFIIARTIIP